ncbi:DUF6376 family protein [Fredinandcohnia sp. FSL W7-1320]|uniref:DUF6376 family protein n=1 Tax=Fredinandcohnia sp. FSL W7-1320 TaxID=2954540 RepID=UPI0030FDC6D6
MKQCLLKSRKTWKPSMDFSHQESQQQIVEYNKQEEEGINLYLHNIENGQFDPALLENSE